MILVAVSEQFPDWAGTAKPMLDARPCLVDLLPGREYPNVPSVRFAQEPYQDFIPFGPSGAS